MVRMQAKDLTEAYYKLNRILFYNNSYDHVRSGVTAHKFQVSLTIDSPVCDLNMHDINYTMSKWKMLLRLYLEPQDLADMCARLLHYYIHPSHKVYVPDIGMSFRSRANVSGACLMALTLGYNTKQGWHCNVFTRASELTMRWYVDLIFIHVLIKNIAEAVGFDWKEVKILWTMVSTYQSITSMPLFIIMDGDEDWLIKGLAGYHDEDNEGFIEGYSPWQVFTIKRYEKVFLKGGYQSYRVQKRPLEAYMMLKGLMERKKEVWTEELELGFDLPALIKESQEGNIFVKGGGK